MHSDGLTFEEYGNIILAAPHGWHDYALVDSGDGRKLERFGKYYLIRPEPEAIWKPALSSKEWERADSRFDSGSEKHGGHWINRREIENRWQVNYGGLRFWIQPSASRHVGVFPEQATHWNWIEEQVRRVNRPIRMLNLFGYTGIASLAAARSGAQVTHLDASQRAIQWARENQAVSELEDRPIRWIKDDAVKFVKREIRRSSRYDAVILDPPKFGRGPQGEVWEFYELIPTLLDSCSQILSEKPLFVIITAYAVKASSLTLYNAISEMMSEWEGQTSAGELVLREQTAGRLLSKAIFARWKSAGV